MEDTSYFSPGVLEDIRKELHECRSFPSLQKKVLLKHLCSVAGIPWEDFSSLPQFPVKGEADKEATSILDAVEQAFRALVDLVNGKIGPADMAGKNIEELKAAYTALKAGGKSFKGIFGDPEANILFSVSKASGKPKWNHCTIHSTCEGDTVDCGSFDDCEKDKCGVGDTDSPCWVYDSDGCKCKREDT